MKLKQRKPTDALYFVELVDAADDSRNVAVGNFWAGNENEAITEAQRVYAGLFRSMETNSWKPRATFIHQAEKRSPRDRYRTENQQSLFEPTPSIGDVAWTNEASTLTQPPEPERITGGGGSSGGAGATGSWDEPAPSDSPDGGPSDGCPND